MFYIIQIIIIFLIVLKFTLSKKIELNENKKIFLFLTLVAISTLSNIILNFIPLPTSEVTLTALSEKNEDSTSFEVKLVNLEVDSKELMEFDLNEGKWMRNDEAYYMWRDEDDTRQPNGLTHGISFDVPLGLDRNIVFRTDEFSGIVQIYDETQTQIIDLYSQGETIVKVAITSNTKSEMNKVMIKRLTTWFVISFYIFAFFGFLYHIVVKNPKNKNFIILSLILLAQVSIMVYHGNEKIGFHVDEVWTYETANKEYDADSTYHIANDNRINNTWLKNDFINNLLTVQDDLRFNYKDIYNTQSNGGVHPLLYYFTVHTFASFFPNTFSKWFGIVPNIIFFALGIIVLYKISQKIFDDRFVKWLPIILWGFSIGAISSVVFVRMYVLQTLATLLFIYCYLKYVYNQEIKDKSMMLMFLVTYFGCMTQYYFLIFAFFFTAYECFKRLFTKDYKNMFLFGLSVLFGVIMLGVTFPASIGQLFSESRGSEAISNLKGTDDFFLNLKVLGVNLNYYISIIERQIFGITLETKVLIKILLQIPAIVLFIVFVVYKYFGGVKFNKNEKFKIKINFKNSTKLLNKFFMSKLTPIFMTSVIYIIMVAWISPMREERYVVCTFPLLCLLSIYCFEKLLCWVKFKYTKIILSSIVFIVVFSTAFLTGPLYLYKQYENLYYYIGENSDIPVIYLSSGYEWDITSGFQFLIHHDNVLIYQNSDLNELPDLVNQNFENSDKMIVYLPNLYYDKFDQVVELLGYDTFENLCSNYKPLYRLSNQKDKVGN